MGLLDQKIQQEIVSIYEHVLVPKVLIDMLKLLSNSPQIVICRDQQIDLVLVKQMSSLFRGESGRRSHGQDVT
jgi:hypothetical protein